MHKNYLTIDIGASSGRHIVGWMENGVLRTEEVYRFPNSVRRVDGHLEWDIHSLFVHVKQGIREAFAKYPEMRAFPSTPGRWASATWKRHCCRLCASPTRH